MALEERPDHDCRENAEAWVEEVIVLRSVLALLVLAQTGTTSVEKVCIGDAFSVNARAEGCGSSIQPTTEDRLYVAIDDERRRVTFGRLLASANATPIKLSVTALDGLPSDCAMTIKGTAVPGTWRVDVVPQKALIERELVFAPGKYELSVACADYEPFSRVLDAREGSAAQKTVVGSLERIPRISGRVVVKGGSVIAQIDDDNGHNLGLTSPSGEFSIAIPRKAWPARVEIGAPGYGTETRELPATPSVLELSDVQLATAGRIVISGSAEKLREIQSVDVFRVAGVRGKTLNRSFDAVELKRASYEIARLAPGKYLIVASGKKPLQKYGQLIEIAAGETSRFDAHWSDHEFEVRAFLGEDRLGDAEIRIESVEALWNSTFTLAPDGSADVGLWQPGEFVYLLQATKDIFHSGSMDFTPPTVTIRVPRRSVEGHVVEEISGEPLEGVQVVLAGGGSMRQAKSEADGSFRFVGVNAGAFQVTAGGTDGLSRESIPITLSEDAQSRSVRMKLQRRRQRTIEITTARGAPAAAATVFDVSDNAVLGVATTDNNGIVRLPQRPRNSLIIIDGDRTVHTRVVTGEEATSIGLLGPVANITITTEAGEDHPIEGISLAMRVNGVLFPVEMMGTLAARTGLNLRSDARGRIRLTRLPIGMYEFWPVRSRSDVEAVLSGRPGPAPVVLNVIPGENVARLTFASVDG